MRAALPAAILLVAMAPTLVAHEATFAHGAREDTYPPEIANVTHAPWSPARGEDVRVALTAAAYASTPDRVTMIFCRVEPEYVCALPVGLSQDADGHWSGTIGWSRFMRTETVHVGYNVTLTYEEDDGTRRVAAPTHNVFVPAGFPAATGGAYWFVAYAGSRDSPLASVGVMIMAIGIGFVAAIGRRARG